MGKPNAMAGIRGNESPKLPDSLEFHNLMEMIVALEEMSMDASAHLNNKLVDGGNGLNCNIEYSNALVAARAALDTAACKLRSLCKFH